MAARTFLCFDRCRTGSSAVPKADLTYHRRHDTITWHRDAIASRVRDYFPFRRASPLCLTVFSINSCQVRGGLGCLSQLVGNTGYRSNLPSTPLKMAMMIPLSALLLPPRGCHCMMGAWPGSRLHEKGTCPDRFLARIHLS